MDIDSSEHESSAQGLTGVSKVTLFVYVSIINSRPRPCLRGDFFFCRLLSRYSECSSPALFFFPDYPRSIEQASPVLAPWRVRLFDFSGLGFCFFACDFGVAAIYFLAGCLFSADLYVLAQTFFSAYSLSTRAVFSGKKTYSE